MHDTKVEIYQLKKQSIHYHQRAIEIMIVLRGKLRVTCERAEYLIEEGGLFTAARGQIHWCESLHDRCVVASVQIDLSEVSKELRHLEYLSLKPYISAEEAKKDQVYLTLRNLIVRLLVLKNIDTFHARTSMENLVTRILHLYSHFDKNPDYYSNLDFSKNEKQIARICRICRYIEQNLRKKITLKDIADCESISVSRLAHFWKDMTGVSLQESINLFRVHEASKLILNTDASISEIIYKSGFSDARYFYRNFQKTFGVNPSEYRTNAKRQLGSDDVVKIEEIESHYYVVSEYVIKMYEGVNLSADTYSDFVITTILTHPAELYDYFIDRTQSSCYFTLAPGKLLVEKDEGVEIVWEAIYSIMHLYSYHNMPGEILIRFDQLNAEQWCHIVNELLEEISLIWGKSFSKSINVTVTLENILLKEECLQFTNWLKDQDLLYHVKHAFLF